MALVSAHIWGKFRLWSKAGGPPPPGFADFGPEVWTGNAATEARGIKVLGTPLGHDDFVALHAAERLREEEAFLHKVGRLGDLQCAWLLLTYCAVPRANHFLRVLPPRTVAAYARTHDASLWKSFCELLGCTSSQDDVLA